MPAQVVVSTPDPLAVWSQRAPQAPALHSGHRGRRGVGATAPIVVAMSREGSGRWRVGLGAALVLVVGAIAGGVLTQAADAPSAHQVVVPTPSVEAPGTILVDVQGAVVRPGVYALADGARVLDAIARAGGLAPEAAPGALNLARVVVDGEQLLVPIAGAAPAGAPVASAAGGLTSLNTADQAALEELPRVGPALAGAIIAYREGHGPFTDIAELDDVPGIGPALMAQLEPLVTL